MTTKITWYGHAAIGIHTDGHFLLVDPYLSNNPLASEKPENLSPDFILVSHGHGDHLGDTRSISKRSGATVICNTEISAWLAKSEIKTHAMQIGGSHQFPFGRVALTFAIHGSVLPDGTFGGNPCGFLITTLDQQKIYLAGDTGLFGDMRLIGEEGIDLAMLPIGGNYTMDPDDALRAVKLLNPHKVVPIHYDTFEIIRQDPQRWAERVRTETKAEVQVLKPGDTLSL